MKNYKIIEKRPEVYVDSITCDICKKEIKDSSYIRDKITINARISDVFPEGDFREIYLIDVCKECFFNKVKPLLENELKVKFRKHDVEALDRKEELDV